MRSASSPRQLGKPIPEVGLTTFRMPYTPVTFGVLAGMARGELFDPVRKTPMHEWAAEHGAVFEDVGLWKRARYFPRARRGHACGRRPRMPGGPQRLRDLRRYDTRQDRGCRTGCGRIPESPVHQQLVEPCCRPRALRDPAARGWFHLRRRRDRSHGRESFPRDDDDRRCGARTQHDGGLPPDGMAGPCRVADVDHRAMGGHRRARAARAARARTARHAGRHLIERPAAHGRGARQYSRSPDDAVSRQLQRRARLRDQRACRQWAGRLGSGLRGGHRARHRALRHRGHARAARRKGLRHRRPGHRRHRDAGRCGTFLGHRPRQVGLRRQALARARGDEKRASKAARGPAHAGIRRQCSRRARSSSRRRD